MPKNKSIIKKQKILVAVSGGVDSAVAAQLLKNQGHEVIGVFMQFWKDDGFNSADNNCCSLESWSDAQAVCQQVGIPLYALNFAQEFKRRVVNNFLTAYQSGLTPNPCVLCNKQVKLGRLIKYAQKIGFDAVASGHYVKRLSTDQGYQLWRAADHSKDQSYFLYQLDQHDLAMLNFPLGDFQKSTIRNLAAEFNLPVANKAESQEICFVPDSLANFLARRLKFKSGPICDQTGRQIGQHRGLPFYTIGQRRGVEIGGTGPYYVVKLDLINNTLVVTDQANDPQLFVDKFFLPRLFWLSGNRPRRPIDCQVAIRYHHQAVSGRLTRHNRGWLVELASSQRAVTPGQSAVFYDGDQLLGGGIIALDNTFC